MREEIKARIEAVRCGEVPDGYCKKYCLMPVNWNFTQLKNVAKKVSKKNKNGEDIAVLSNSAVKGVVLQRKYFEKDIANDENTDGYFVVEPKDYIYNPRISNHAPFGPIKRNNLGHKGIVSPLYTVFRPVNHKLIDERYLEYFFLSTQWNRFVYTVSNQGVRFDRMNITDDDFFCMPIVIPPLAEQQKIAEILSTCDRVIELKQQLLDEKRKALWYLMALIFENSDEYKTLSKIAKITMGQSPDSSSYNTDEDGVPLLQGNADIANGLPLPRYYTNSPTKMCSPGDLLLSVRAPVGAVSKAHISACIGRGMCSINAGKLTEYVFYYLKYYEPNWNRISQGSTFTAISGDDIKKVPIPVADEKTLLYQAKILSCADTEIHLLEQELEAWQQKKKALMQLLLTGLVRV